MMGPIRLTYRIHCCQNVEFPVVKTLIYSIHILFIIPKREHSPFVNDLDGTADVGAITFFWTFLCHSAIEGWEEVSNGYIERQDVQRTQVQT